MKIFVIRHPQTQWNLQWILQWHLDSPLTDFGIETANKLANNLKEKNITKIISSDLWRCKQTSNIIWKELGLDYEIDRLLRERDFWDYNGKDKEETKNKIDLDDFELVLPNWESIKQMSERVIDFINNFQEKYNLTKEDNVLLVAHHWIVLSLLYYSTNKDNIKFYQNIIWEFEFLNWKLEFKNIEELK